MRDLKGKPLEAASVFLQQVSGLRIKDDPAWQYFKDMQDIRDILVHRDGRRGDLAQYQKDFDRLVGKYEPDLSRADLFLSGTELTVSMRLCRRFAQESQDFFKRLFIKLGFQHSGLNMA